MPDIAKDSSSGGIMRGMSISRYLASRLADGGRKRAVKGGRKRRRGECMGTGRVARMPRTPRFFYAVGPRRR